MVSRCIATIDQQEGCTVHSVAVMKNKNQFVSAADLDPSGNDFLWSIKLWDIETRQYVRTFSNFSRGRRSRCRVLSLDDESFLCNFVEIHTLVLYNTASDNYVKIIEVDNGARYTTSLAILDRDRFLIGNNDGNVKVWSFETGERQRTLHLEDNHHRVSSISKFDDDTFLCGSFRKVLLCNVETGEVMKSFDADGRTGQIAVVDSERFLTVQHDVYKIMNTMDGYTKASAWNANSGECIQSMFSDSRVLQAIPVRGHGILFAHEGDANIQLRGDDFGNLKRCFVGHEEAVLSIDLVTDTTFISGSSDGTIKIWDLSRWPDLKTLICLRKLVRLGRAEKISDVHCSKRLRDGRSKKIVCHQVLPSLEALVCEMPDEIFRTVLSFLA